MTWGSEILCHHGRSKSKRDKPELMVKRAVFKGVLQRGSRKNKRKFLVMLVSGFGTKDQTGVIHWTFLALGI